jgi:hypothetical protein
MGIIPFPTGDTSGYSTSLEQEEPMDLNTSDINDDPALFDPPEEV